MNGTKWYKLNKSNEPILVTLHEELLNLESTISGDLSSALITVAEIVFSGLLTYFIEKKVDLLSPIWPYLGVVPNGTLTILGTVLSCSIVFLGTIGACKLAVFIVKRIKKNCRDEKKTLLGIYQLERYFYQKVLNEIITGVSLEKKSFELLSEIESSSSPVQDKNLSSIYLVEAVFYFYEALGSIKEKHLFEVSNKNRQEYTDFLNAIDPHVMCEILLMCEETLTRIVTTLEADNNQNTKRAKDAYNLFLSYRREIHKQMDMEPVVTPDMI